MCATRTFSEAHLRIGEGSCGPFQPRSPFSFVTPTPLKPKATTATITRTLAFVLHRWQFLPRLGGAKRVSASQTAQTAAATCFSRRAICICLCICSSCTDISSFSTICGCFMSHIVAKSRRRTHPKLKAPEFQSECSRSRAPPVQLGAHRAQRHLDGVSLIDQP